MSPTRWIATVTIAIFLLACARPKVAPDPVIPSNWKRIDLSRFFFRVPPDIERQFLDSVDSEVWHAEYSTMRLACDYGQYSSDLRRYSNQSEYHSEWLLVGGKAANIETVHITDRDADYLDKDRPYHASIYFPGVGSGRAKLDCSVHGVNATALENAKTIFLSIRFK